MSFEVVAEFERNIAAFFNAPNAISVDCCTHGLELCLRQQDIKKFSVPARTYISVPLLAKIIIILAEQTLLMPLFCGSKIRISLARLCVSAFSFVNI